MDPDAKTRHDAALALDAAKYQLKPTAWFRGRERSLKELRKIAGKPMFPLPPFDEQLYEEQKQQAAMRANAAAVKNTQEQERLEDLFRLGKVWNKATSVNASY